MPVILMSVVLSSHKLAGNILLSAMWLQGYKRKKVYIGAQGKTSIQNELTSYSFAFSAGPTHNSVEDFWRMMWEQQIPTIVMLTRVFEGRVCAS